MVRFERVIRVTYPHLDAVLLVVVVVVAAHAVFVVDRTTDIILIFPLLLVVAKCIETSSMKWIGAKFTLDGAGR